MQPYTTPRDGAIIAHSLYNGSMKVALVHDYLREYGGAERVVEALHEMFPKAPLYVAFYDPAALGPQAQRFAGWDIRESPLTKLPLYKRLFSPYRLFSAWAFSQLDLSEFDVVISSTNMYMAKGVRVKPGARHLSYIHTPPRSLYGLSTQTDWRRNPIIRLGGGLINLWMRRLDWRTAQNPDLLIANGRTTQERIKKHYQRDSVMIYPPVALVDAGLKVLPAEERSYALFVGRLAYSKHPELAVQVCRELDLPLKVVGTGSLSEGLAAQASEKVEFLGSVDDTTLRELYQHARVLLFPAEDEDFGIVPIEAMAAGTPVVAHYSGEPRFTVTGGLSGFHVQTFDPDDWKKTVERAWKYEWDYRAIQQSVEEFSKQNFMKRIRNLLA